MSFLNTISMKNLKKTALFTIALFAATYSCFGLFGRKTETEDGNAELNLPPYNGIKHAIGVLPFEEIYRWRGDYDLRANMTTMLENVLLESGRFVVVERESIKKTMMEQDLQSSGRAAQASDVAQTGQIRSAKYLAKVKITGVEMNESGQKGGLSFKGVSVGGSGGKAQIEIIVEIFDSSTSEIKASQRIVGKAGKRGISVGFRRSGLGGNFGGFSKTPIGEAAYDCVAQAAKFLAGKFEEYPINGTVIMTADDGSVVIDIGSQYNVAEGTKFQVRTAGEVMIHPRTGEVLGRSEGKVTATIQVTNRIFEKFSYCDLLDGELPVEGDVVYGL
jgi:curli biogenesis system outer membrane secretion channel CsgG